MNAHAGMWRAVGAAAAGAAVYFAAPASADQIDDSFLAEIQRNGIVFTDRGAAITAGHNMCAGLDKGKSPTSLVLNVVRATDLSAHEAGYLLGASVASYCPQHRATIGN
ncbi:MULTISPECIES: DUF732 domain-containing protein [unclassified Mycobacterium]|uniref:DUF732 domain-containing protein n=1 Tax=unclassified Mycobacterium TaxID=2642494 RepID=UPI0007FEB7F2|nr:MULTISPECIES: DUF732 domain-containing protein [unclassified Mycobacterium]OBG56992.1 hypothetical protein A5704_23500 [Mycobacterium sp. E735]OBG64255.1 hypothetical protein A5703_18230 [Mycobacterium sp. E188]OBH23630.1 hypothetical protein A9X03_14505 [Mycobacterium sp. E1715]OBH45288.1 hypothetical protein A5691_15625 [Mycobacterium sp. E183]